MGSTSRPAVGANAIITLANETVQGTPPAKSALNRRFDFTSESMSATESVLESASIRNTRARPRQNRGVLDVGGDLSCEFAPDGYGRLIYHALGSYSSAINGADGAVRGRIGEVVGNGAVGASQHFLPFTADFVVGFPTGGGDTILVYKRQDGTMVVDNNGGSFYSYDEFARSMKTEVTTGVTLNSGSTTLRLNNVGGLTFNTLGGATAGDGDEGFFYLEVGALRYKIHYDEVTDNTTNADYNVTQINGVSISSTSLVVPAGAPAWMTSTLFAAAGLFVGHSDANKGYGVGTTAIGTGMWVYGVWDQHPTYNIYTHHFEVGSELPVGLSVEVLRDSVNFLYTGNMVNSATWTFDPQAYVTATFSLVGMTEYSVVKLVNAAVVGATSIVVDSEPVAFPSAGTLTIGTETGIVYTGITANANGTYTFTGIPASGATSIQSTHYIGENVDANVTSASSPPSLIDTPKYSSFEAAVTRDMELIEVLSGSITIENSLGDDKYILGSRGRAAVREGRSSVSGNLNVEFDDGGHYMRFIKGSGFSVEFRLLSEDEDYTNINGIVYPIGTYFFCPLCKYNGTTPNVDDESYITHDLPFDSFEDNAMTFVTAPLVIVNTNRNSSDS